MGPISDCGAPSLRAARGKGCEFVDSLIVGSARPPGSDTRASGEAISVPGVMTGDFAGLEVPKYVSQSPAIRDK